MEKSPELLNLQLRLTRRCNMTCSHCYTTSSPKVEYDYFPIDKAKKLILEAEYLGLRIVTLIGGEPLLHPDFHEIVQFIASRKNITMELETNGLLLNKYQGILNDFPRKFAIEVSIDGTTTRGEKETELAFKSLDTPLRNAHKCVQTLCSYNNIDTDFYDICMKVNQKEIDHVIYMGPSGCGRGRDMNYLSWDDCKTVINTLVKNKYDNIRIELPPLITKSKTYGCGWNTYRLEVLPDGSSTTCVQAFYEDEHNMGLANAFDYSLVDIWNDNNKLNSLRNIKKYDMSGACSICEYWNGCFGSCRSWAQSWDNERKWTASYLRCDEYLADTSIDNNFFVPNKEISLLKLQWCETKYKVAQPC